jgi:hypothetical protein
MITLTEAEWAEIHQQLAQEHPPSWLLIRESMKRNLGFTVRRHHQWIHHKPSEGKHSPGYYRDEVCLDFFNEAQETFFRLKYL